MNTDDARRITDLADRIRLAPPQAKDPEAEQIIAREIAPQQDAFYLLVQAVLLQEEALRQSQTRIAELERGQTQTRGGFLGGIFGGGGQPAPAPEPPARGGGFGAGSFLATAAAGAVGVAGGALLFSGIQSMLSGDHGGFDAGYAAGAAEAGGHDAGGFDAGGFDGGDWA